MTTTKAKNVRETALELLITIEKNQSYSNLLLNHAIKKNEIPQKDVGLLTELIYGTLQRRKALDFYLKPFLKNSKKIEKWVLYLLRLTLYQMVYLDKIPDRAAIHEAVEIAKKRGHKGIAGLVNGVLRNLQRNGLPSLEQVRDPIEKLAIETSHPEWLVKRWVEQFGFEKTKAMCEVNLTAPLQTARVNLTKISRDECVTLLEKEGFQIEKSPVIPEAIKVLKGNLAFSKAFKEGLLTIQDESSMLVAHALGIEQNELILDACAAPGGKTTHIAEILNDTGEVISLDLHEHKVKLINENASRLGLSNVKPMVMDSRQAVCHFKKESFDKVLLDAPCSGLGVMRRKPDMKYTKKEQDVYQLSQIQQDLLSAVAPLVKKGGTLVYSTCTVDKEENEQNVRRFLQDHPEFEGYYSFIKRMPEAVQPLINGFDLQIFPQDFGSDGFYIAVLKRKV
ncbi:16S rRNA (cytosine(967)-C(5))-methyltransferase RsmB [Neobacillus thermocopriae]|uniref:16S rRNA (cytosine(967)-C(5))-methyltransferase n=1 Tax=Neobacillus thermocopriae TaxID=1215031 RepID=A0A6B3TMV6_9BACI|nr:16S rRNA (cytosine(967)-C(5))-methyltransferase RsmB [Neobacillus thermocopriae]MED3624276.1 16S rRNA (cytosine(967)-C(5))-methyltransferase RsmB [Neobacillus thermocopriae]MED3713529.1 16S rRNA (cytosine(967)-C(5))-methyltransferase RsmB [Neobacillus thermocopriae]NEX77639.1 16S rRNA (cytosine(967)-C(5))-methyltransferase RsmB [Neobacillus thermocopriae]